MVHGITKEAKFCIALVLQHSRALQNWALLYAGGLSMQLFGYSGKLVEA